MPHIPKGTIRKPSDLYKLPWDIDDNVKVSPEEFKRITQSWDDSLKDENGFFR